MYGIYTVKRSSRNRSDGNDKVIRHYKTITDSTTSKKRKRNQKAKKTTACDVFSAKVDEVANGETVEGKTVTDDTTPKKKKKKRNKKKKKVAGDILSAKVDEIGEGNAIEGLSATDITESISGEMVSGVRSMTSSAQMVTRRTTSHLKTPAMSRVGSLASVRNMSGPFNATSLHVGKEADKTMREKFSKIDMLTIKYQLNNKENKIPKDETYKMPLSKSLVGGSMNVCKTRVLHFVQSERVLQGNGFLLMPKSRTRMILLEKQDDGTVAMQYGKHDECDHLTSKECLPTLPNTVSFLIDFDLEYKFMVQ
nr:hypothetical protein [Tanacetum cinerariifolium]